MTPQELIKAALDCRAVTGLIPGESRIPAAWIIGMPFKYVMDRLPTAKLYKPKRKKLNIK